MAVIRSERLQLRAGEDIVRARQLVRQWCIEQGFSLVDQTKLVTAASELARNTVEHGGGGEVHVEMLRDGIRRGIQLRFVDQGKGIANMELAMRDGYTTGSGLGLGLSGSKRLCSEFHIESQPGKGTRVTIARWK